MATTEQTGILTYVDEDGNLHLLYPVTNIGAVDGLADELNNAQTAADNAQTAADNAQTAADNAQTAADKAQATANNAVTVIGEKKFEATATIGTGWSGSAAPYTQAVTVTGILETDKPHIFPVYSSSLETALAQQEAWAMVSRAVTSANTITFYCFEDKPTTAIPIQIEVNR